MNIAIVGLNREGLVSFDYYNNKENRISVFDANEAAQVPSGAANAILGKDYLQQLAANDYDLILRTPGLPAEKLIAAGIDKDVIWSGTNEFFKVCPTKNIIGITGTKGKGTTTSLIVAMLKKAGYRVHVGGNIGRPALDLLNDNIKPEDWVVLELSSFQLSDIQFSPHIAVCLLIVPEHLDWHNSFEHYINSKANLFRYQSDADFAVYYAKSEDSHHIASHSKGVLIPYYSPPGAYVDEHNTINIESATICTVSDIALLGKHNWQNVCAAVTAVWRVTQDTKAIREAIKEFQGLEHRIEFLCEKNGIRYYNDSFATGLHATTAAINAIPEQKIVIIGGHDRMLDIDGFGDFIKNDAENVKHIVLIGDSKERVAKLFTQKGIKNFTISNAATMQKIVAEAQTHASSGDAIVLSPGFASFGLFNNFEERGLAFKEEVAKLS